MWQQNWGLMKYMQNYFPETRWNRWKIYLLPSKKESGLLLPETA